MLQAIAARLIRVFRSYMARRTGGDEVSRIETLARVFRNAAAVVIVIVAGTLVLDELGISIAPILATAGVAGVAIGFGAQSLIKDYFNGFFLLLDDQVREGDVVEVAGKAGLVEEVTLRYEADIDKALAVMLEVGHALRGDPAWAAKLAGEIEVLGVERLADSAVILRSRLRVVPPIEQWNVRREFLKRLKNAYDERGIELPSPPLTLHTPKASAA